MTGTLAEGSTMGSPRLFKRGSYKGSAVLLLEGKQAVRKDFSVKVASAVSAAGQPGVLPVVPGVHEKIRGFSAFGYPRRGNGRTGRTCRTDITSTLRSLTPIVFCCILPRRKRAQGQLQGWGQPSRSGREPPFSHCRNPGLQQEKISSKGSSSTEKTTFRKGRPRMCTAAERW